MVEKNKIYTEKTITQEILNYLNKNRDFFVKNPKILDILDFPDKWKIGNKIIDFNAFHSKKLKVDNKRLRKEYSIILNAGRNNIAVQNRIFQATLKIITTKSINSLFDIILNECPIDMKLLKKFFPNTHKYIKSYVLLKINMKKDKCYIISIGSKDKNKFFPTQGTDLISFFAKACEIKIKTML